MVTQQLSPQRINLLMFVILALYPLVLKELRARLLSITMNSVFMGLVLCMASAYCLLIVFNTLGPFLIQNHMGLSAITFGHLALLAGVVYLSSTVVARRLIKAYDPLLVYKRILPTALGVVLFFLGLGFILPHSLLLLMLGMFG